jgi:hypothetical protein
MTKYAPLKDFLARQTASEVPMSFVDIERTIGETLPASASKYPAWWSNNPSNNVMTKAWLEAGYKTERVDLHARRLVFRKADVHRPSASVEIKKAVVTLDQIHGALRGTVRTQLDLTLPTGEVWAAEID